MLNSIRIKAKLFIILFVFITFSFAQKSTILAVSNEVIDIDTVTVKKHLYALADDAMEGRKAGTPGIEKAAQYIENEFERIGLTPFSGLKTYRQNFKEKELDLFNLIGVLEGKSKKDEYVLISAHYDHLGVKENGNGDVIFNGADDDASGVSAILALAEFFKKKNDNERSIIFVAFTAEEMGLVGSTYFGKHINPDQFVAGINIEMIGKESKFGPKSAWLTGFDRSDFGLIIQKNLKNTGYKLYPNPYKNFNLFYRSDNAAMAKLGIPAHTFSTGPIDNDKHYHNVSDEAETLNITTITETIKAIGIGTESIINGNDTPSRIKN
ncbi:M20/M25/M40 family metallo-hydrolase [Aureibaculum marinum]|uniref:M20/M25/M40 family metallo-hydrolase n=1 Tax=Aureibaculum marinum TaxID=2487930 RepID=A0A3N4NUP0_9FLAO|nr:M20/M25/M40 family metallo-hydrolase [Aureibaculum marinum]RPD96756.1 M20/M25/M40 family metallo-hydrolase [Aureibaculum marinum]